MIFDILRKGENNRVLTPQQLEVLTTGGAQGAAGLSVTPETAARFGTVFACVRVRAESIGQLPCNLFEQTGRDKQKAVDHPLYTLLHDAPNEATTAQEFWEWVSASLDLRGNAYVFINQQAGKVFELMPLQAAWVTPMLDKKRDVVYTVKIPDGTGNGGTAKNYTSAEILHFKLMSFNGVTGASVIEQCREAIGLGMATERHGARFFKNGAQPGGVLETAQVLDDETYDALRNDWDSAHRGLDNAHRVAILEAGLSYKTIGLSLSDSQFLEGRKFSQTEIAGLFRVPPHLIGNLENATFSNIEQQGLDFVIHGLMPTLTRCEQRAKLQLLTLAERASFFVKFNVGGLVRGDMAARGAFYTAMISARVLNPNEVRDLEDLNPYDGGDEFTNPNTTAGTPPRPGAATATPAEDEDDTTGGNAP